MIVNNLSKTLTIIPIVFDLEEPWFLEKFVMFLRIETSVFLTLTITEICIFKYWLKFILKRLIIMDNQRIVLVLTLENLMMSTLFALVRIHKSDDKYLPQYSGRDKL